MYRNVHDLTIQPALVDLDYESCHGLLIDFERFSIDGAFRPQTLPHFSPFPPRLSTKKSRQWNCRPKDQIYIREANSTNASQYLATIGAGGANQSNL